MVQLNYHIREVTIESLQYTDSVVKTVNEAYQTGGNITYINIDIYVGRLLIIR